MGGQTEKTSLGRGDLRKKNCFVYGGQTEIANAPGRRNNLINTLV